MHVTDLHNTELFKNITVVMNYDEVRDINNALYHASKDDPKYQQVYTKVKVIFDLIKHGMIQPETCGAIVNLANISGHITDSTKDQSI